MSDEFLMKLAGGCTKGAPGTLDGLMKPIHPSAENRNSPKLTKKVAINTAIE